MNKTKSTAEQELNAEIARLREKNGIVHAAYAASRDKHGKINEMLALKGAVVLLAKNNERYANWVQDLLSKCPPVYFSEVMTCEV
jgi:hypothetical protein